ncbi:hypothetical protein [Desulfosarcina sp.]|uniref:hypothetical protein n=1 Tax=Desulfosarcina sp. TaxID=2027861 RepID=UPI00356430B1
MISKTSLRNQPKTDKTGKLHVKLPVMAANMDTVTETAMADFIGAKAGDRRDASVHVHRGQYRDV